MCSGASNLDHRRMTHVYLVKSSTTTKMYLFPPRDSVLTGPIEVRYLGQVGHLQVGFESFSLLHVPRIGNTHADSLATLATSLAQSLFRVILANPRKGRRYMFIKLG